MKFQIRKLSPGSAKSRKNRFKMPKWLKYSCLTAVTIVLTMTVYFSEQTGVWFKASVLDLPQPFNGTVYPIAKVPNYLHWSTQKYDRFETIPKSELINLPEYNLDLMRFPDENLVWGESSQNSIRNSKITFPVVYMGNYKYDHTEYKGSHLAVDIKVPEGTPVHVIANGKVVKTSMANSGFGHHIVVEHYNVPDPDRPGKTTNLFSAYNHLDEIQVSEGQNVLKGQVIASSGNTGTSTTPHLHFQLDKDSAPWHPYWPFTWAESQAAGLSFFEAVNAGLGISDAKKYTVNPMAFVKKYLNYSAVASTGESSPPSAQEEPVVIDSNVEGDTEGANSETIPSAEEPVVETPPVVIETESFTAGSESSLFTFDISGERVALKGSGLSLLIQDNLNQINSLGDDERIVVEHTGVGQLLTKSLKKSDFNNKVARVTVRSDETGTTTIGVGKSNYKVSFIDGVKPVAKLMIDHDGYFQESIVETIQVIALDEDGNISPSVNFPGIMTVKANRGQVRVTPNELSASDFKGGVASVRVVITDKSPVTFKAQNGALVGESKSMNAEESEVFTDIKPGNPNYAAIKYLMEKNIISGYSDGSFKPEKTVNRAEALKMLMVAFNVNADSTTTLSFNDVDPSAWYAGTLSTAVNRGIVAGYSDGSFKPGNTVNRAEYFKLLFGTNQIKPSTEITKPYNDVSLDQWFAGYAYLANKMNVLDAGKQFKPSAGMTRGLVAETIYRMKMIQDNNLLVYSK